MQKDLRLCLGVWAAACLGGINLQFLPVRFLMTRCRRQWHQSSGQKIINLTGQDMNLQPGTWNLELGT